MCGIVGVRGRTAAVSVVRSGLARLEYRGYDSAGVAWADATGIELQKDIGRVLELADTSPGSESMAIGHTRWATHGGVTRENAHPHLDATGRFAVVHNGTIDGHHRLRAALEAQGHAFRSSTDSEVLAHLYERHRRTMDPLDALRSTFDGLHGSWAAVFLDSDADVLAFARHRTPLCIGVLPDGVILASDVTAVIAHTRDIMFLDDGDHGIVGDGPLELFDAEGRRKPIVTVRVDWDAAQAEKAGYAHFTLKEIHEAPQALNDCLAGRVHRHPLRIDLGVPEAMLANVRRVRLVGCGTSYHAALMGRQFIEEWAGLPAEAVIASDLRDRPLFHEDGTLYIGISQSGETLDTLEALKHVQKAGYPMLAITNVRGSTIERIADAAVLTHVGPEVGVAATKTLLGQTTILALLALELGRSRGHLGPAQVRRLTDQLERLPRVAEAVLRHEPKLQEMAQSLSRASDLFFLGRGIHAATAHEAALKFKEITYQHAEGFGAAELKHGPFALLGPETPCVFFLPLDGRFDKTLANIMEVQARGAPCYVVSQGDCAEVEGVATHSLCLQRTDPLLAVVPFAIAGQLLAYHAAAALQRDVDRPRNLAKSVTVE